MNPGAFCNWLPTSLRFAAGIEEGADIEVIADIEVARGNAVVSRLSKLEEGEHPSVNDEGALRAMTPEKADAVREDVDVLRDLALLDPMTPNKQGINILRKEGFKVDVGPSQDDVSMMVAHVRLPNGNRVDVNYPDREE